MSHKEHLDALRAILEQRGACYGCGDTRVFFASDRRSVEEAQQMCGGCPTVAKSACLEYALTVGAEYGVWGGIYFWAGKSFHRRRAPGRPPAADKGKPVVASKEELWDLVSELSPMRNTA